MAALSVRAISACFRVRAGEDALTALLADARPAWEGLARSLGQPDLLNGDTHLVLRHDAKAARQGRAAWLSHSTGTAAVEDAPPALLARLNGAKPPSPRAAMALAKSQEYQDAADAPSTLRAYAGDLANFRAWCEKHGFTPMPATPEIVGAYLAAAGEGYAMPTLRRRVAAIARACGVAGQPLDTKHPAIRETLRGIGCQSARKRDPVSASKKAPVLEGLC